VHTFGRSGHTRLPSKILRTNSFGTGSAFHRRIDRVVA